MEMNSTLFAGSRYRMQWIWIIGGFLAWISVGCSPQSISWMLMPWGDNNIPPEHKLFNGEKDSLISGEKEVTVAVLCTYAQPPLRPELMTADIELADSVAQFLRKRSQDNKHKLKIVPTAEVRGYYHKQLATGDVNKVELGKHFKADYVLEMTISSMSLYEKNTYPAMFRGNTDILVDLYAMDGKETDRKVFSKNFRSEYPGARGPIDASSANPSQFRGLFLTKVSRDITKLFIAYPPEERHVMD